LLLDGSWSGTGHVSVLGPEDLSFNDMAQIMSEVLSQPVRYQQIPGKALKDRLTRARMSDAMAQATVDMMIAKDQAWITPSRAPRSPPLRPASDSGARKSSSRPSWPDAATVTSTARSSR
jgi:hypothetical protein